MKKYPTMIRMAVLAIALPGALMVPMAVRAADNQDSAQINKLLDDVKAEAVQLKSDAADMKSFTMSSLTWPSYAEKIEMIKGHVNDAGKLLARLHDAKSSGSPWQQKAIDEIDPLLRDMADNTTATIDHLNKNQSRVHFPAFKEYVNANFEIANDLEAVVRNYVDYGKAKQNFERLGDKLEIG